MLVMGSVACMIAAVSPFMCFMLIGSMVLGVMHLMTRMVMPSVISLRMLTLVMHVVVFMCRIAGGGFVISMVVIVIHRPPPLLWSVPECSHAGFYTASD